MINPDGLDADNGGKCISIRGLGKGVRFFQDDMEFWHPVFTLDNSDRESENGWAYLEHTDFLGPNLNHF